uniref:Hypothetical secreted peptide n=1 Tax=Glossina morsitans morsitans TaxID=37546 RepID=D3TSI6_GLOMM
MSHMWVERRKNIRPHVLHFLYALLPALTFSSRSRSYNHNRYYCDSYCSVTH